MRALNKNRIRDSRIALLISTVILLLAQPLLHYGNNSHEILEFTGSLLVVFCAVGRIYTTAFIGGLKNSQLVTWGPYSVTRNPLYLFSLIGITGIAMIMGFVSLVIVNIIVFSLLYHFLITREETFLRNEFGDVYSD